MRQAMRGIEPLPVPLRNSIRSGVIVFDLTRVVEELLFNSLDASATKVSVFVGAETGCVKVMDNGSGISRDGLILLGERYVTSKLCSDTFGFRGETLASISDVSSLEIVTRTCGRPNGYRKVIKGSKCLYFGIDDKRKDVGTTVVVRDLFYNQPVRRKFIQSSSKKVLQSVKKCVLRVALVHSRVSFQIIDIESEKELLSTYRSSAMSILMSDYGIDEVNCLHKLDFSDGFLSLSGYITRPSEDFSAKAFQYVYINSRFVFKGPIHKLLNHLAMTFEVLDSWGAISGKGKRSRAQVCIAYIMNLYCPRNLYDLTLEPSKTYADFKDWGPILTFIQKAVQQVWSKIRAGEHSSHRVDLHSTLWKRNDDLMSKKEGHDLDVVLPETSEVASDKFQRPQYHIAYSPVGYLKKHPDETFNGGYNNKATYEEFEVDFSELKEQQVETRYPYQSGFSMLDVADCGNIPRGTLACNSNLLASHNSFDLPDDILEERHDIMPTYSGDLAGTQLTSVWQNDSSKIESAKMEFSSDHETWRKQLETSVSGNNRYRSDSDFTLQEFEVDVSDFNDEVEMRCAYQSGFSMRSKDVMDQDYCSPLFTSRNSFEFLDDKFIEDRDNIRQKYSDDIEGNPLSSDWQNEFPEDESGNITLSSDHEIWDTQLRFGDRGRVPFLHGCSFSPSSNKGLLNCQEEAEHPISESHYPDDKFVEDTHNDKHKYNDDLDGNLVSSDWINEYLNDGSANNISSSNNEVWSKQLKIGESAKDHFFRGRILTRSLSGKGLLNCEEETEVTIVEPLVKRRRVCFNKNVDVIEDEINNQRDDILFGQGEQTFTQGTEPQSDFVPHTGGSISSGNKFPRSNCDSETSDSLFEACWGVENFPQDVNGKNHCHLVGTKKTQLLSLHQPHMSRDKVDWLQLDLPSHDQNSYDKYSEKWDKVGYRSGKKDLIGNYSRRSHSAPPFYKQKKFISLNGSLSVGRKPQAHVVHDQENKITYLEPNSIRALNSTARPEMKHEQSTVPPIEEGLEVKMVAQQCTVGHNSAERSSISPSGSREVEHFTKWTNCAQENRKACDGDSHRSILDITSEFSSLTGSVLIPESLRTNFLKQAKVLQQVDKKFIPVVADGTLAVIDQHAADERIQLEELRDKVLTGNARTISYLDAEQELILPEFGYQLLADYADQVRDWGWICNMRPQSSGTFNKNLNVMHQHRAMVTLIAVPCILGVKLYGGDLLEFLEQLADTDGASTVPPCVVRILNLKACRGAIMFGDSLLPSECALIVEELEKTELCFQCAHGRPTTVPLVNLATLHREIAALMKNDDSVVRRQQIGISRALQRLNAAGDMQPNTVK